jgi:hypothetical protein
LRPKRSRQREGSMTDRKRIGTLLISCGVPLATGALDRPA